MPEERFTLASALKEPMPIAAMVALVLVTVIAAFLYATHMA